MQSTRGHSAKRKVEIEQEYREMVYDAWRRKLYLAGIDPDWIGSHEVKPVCCDGCGKQIPWAIIKGYQN